VYDQQLIHGISLLILMLPNIVYMPIDKKQLEINVNLHAMQPNFLNYELHYVIADSETSFRFAKWNEKPGSGEEKFYFFLTQEQMYIPAGNITLNQSYALREEAIYQCVSSFDDFVVAIEKVKKDGVGKSIRCFDDEFIDVLKSELSGKYGTVEKHVVTSSQGQHLLFVFDDIEVSISATMVYFRHKTPVNAQHYEHVQEEKEGK
jgi:hypothetical protein